ncbi:hypothetical protein COB18_01240 [Candidatus Kaiserbacteria bacterium]|nr:MAG: hypothetical protein COB18_01240 [Candidatus Kaiserbacteria bacterium]
MSNEWWKNSGGPMVMYGVQDLQRNHEPLGPKYLIGVVGVLPFNFIPMNVKTGGFEIARNFKEDEDSTGDNYCFREEHVDWERASRNGTHTSKIARGMLETPGIRWLHFRPWGLMAYGWPDHVDYFPNVLSRMCTVLTEVLGKREFINEPNITFPNREKIEASNRLGVSYPL